MAKFENQLRTLRTVNAPSQVPSACRENRVARCSKIDSKRSGMLLTNFRIWPINQAWDARKSSNSPPIVGLFASDPTPHSYKQMSGICAQQPQWSLNPSTHPLSVAGAYTLSLTRVSFANKSYLHIFSYLLIIG